MARTYIYIYCKNNWCDHGAIKKMLLLETKARLWTSQGQRFDNARRQNKKAVLCLQSFPSAWLQFCTRDHGDLQRYQFNSVWLFLRSRASALHGYDVAEGPRGEVFLDGDCQRNTSGNMHQNHHEFKPSDAGTGGGGRAVLQPSFSSLSAFTWWYHSNLALVGLCYLLGDLLLSQYTWQWVIRIIGLW